MVFLAVVLIVYVGFRCGIVVVGFGILVFSCYDYAHLIVIIYDNHSLRFCGITLSLLLICFSLWLLIRVLLIILGAL